MRATQAFREAFMSAEAGAGAADAFSSADARFLRYQVLWAFYEGTAYRNVHKWATAYREQYGLYRHIRNIYNPAGRLVDFWASHLLGGALDPGAGDGTATPSALPIVTSSNAIRAGLSRLWRDSNFQTQKNVLGLWGAALGDAFLRINDDPEHGRVAIEVVHPGLIRDLITDAYGNVKGYTLEEQRIDPRRKDNMVLYTEIASREPGSDSVYYQTLLNGKPYAWNGTVAEWAEPYGFVPMVALQHKNVGLQWGWSELHQGLGKIREADDMTSLLNDQVRKIVNAPWLFTGVADPGRTPRASATPAVAAQPEPGREETPALYTTNENAKAQALVAPLDIEQTSNHIQTVLKDIERDYPELTIDLRNYEQDISGRALRIHRQPVEDRVKERRAGYDHALVRAFQMALAIGGMRGYDGYSGFGLDSYQAGDLDMRIADRPVFTQDSEDEMMVLKSFYEAATAAANAGDGVPLALFLEKHGSAWGWTRADVQKLWGTGEARREEERALADTEDATNE